MNKNIIERGIKEKMNEIQFNNKLKNMIWLFVLFYALWVINTFSSSGVYWISGVHFGIMIGWEMSDYKEKKEHKR